MKLALAPIPYHWPPDEVRAFYRCAQGWPLDVVYLGETVCAKRCALTLREWLALVDRLAAAGLEAALSTLALMEAESELAVLERICRNGEYPVEANDMAAVRLLEGHAPFIAGPHLNVYNAETLALLARTGAFRWVAPVELPGSTVGALHRQRPQGMQTEVLVFGRLPLAFSARCFTARAHGIPKDRCGTACAAYPEGLSLHTQEGEPLFTVNGVQLQSAAPCNLMGELERLSGLGVEVLRIVPQRRGIEDVVRAFRAALDGNTAEATERLARVAPGPWCNGYWHGGAGMGWQPS
ncbi:MAG: U32 family peptidase [Gammaproteobacteria bacterium]|nr:U32 family peptidase [Gammaproteobacteria bacterium]